MQKRIKDFFKYNPTRTISLSFIMVILVGTFLLSLPISNSTADTSFINHLFVATSATCVTGLVPIVVANQYSLFGQVVILIMIQIGGLGFLTLLMLFFVILKKRLSFSSRLLMQEALNKNSMDKINDFLAYVIKYTLCVEGIGAIVLFTIFIKDYKLSQALYYSVFHSVSAFCNAGFDVLGSTSLVQYNQNPLLLITISGLIIFGGIGFLVVKEIQERVKKYLTSKDRFIKLCQSFSLHTKLVIIMTLSLLFLGTVAVYVFEYNNPNTLGNLTPFYQWLNSFFQSVTYRTAGFASIDQGSLSDVSKLIACIFMMIGGSPAGTAGGIKTITLAVLYLSVRATLKGNDDVVAFSRSIHLSTIRRALAIICISLVIIFGSTILLCISESLPLVDLLFEAFSAFATVGLTSNVTPYLSTFGKGIIIVLMYIGRIGPVAMMLTLMKKRQNNVYNDIKYPEGEILVG